MKIFALLGSVFAASRPSNEQWQGVNLQGNKWSASVGPRGVQYQENGLRISGQPSEVTADNTGVSTYCVDGLNFCSTQLTTYQNYVWVPATESLTATGQDAVSISYSSCEIKTKLSKENSPWRELSTMQATGTPSPRRTPAVTHRAPFSPLKAQKCRLMPTTSSPSSPSHQTLVLKAMDVSPPPLSKMFRFNNTNSLESDHINKLNSIQKCCSICISTT